MSPWKNAGLSYVRFSSIASKAMRRALKPDAQGKNMLKSFRSNFWKPYVKIYPLANFQKMFELLSQFVRQACKHRNKAKLKIFEYLIWAAIRPSLKFSRFHSHDNRAKRKNLKVRFEAKYSQAQKFKSLICTAIRPSSKFLNIWY